LQDEESSVPSRPGQPPLARAFLKKARLAYVLKVEIEKLDGTI
jgi:hypothetical protein